MLYLFPVRFCAERIIYSEDTRHERLLMKFPSYLTIVFVLDETVVCIVSLFILVETSEDVETYLCKRPPLGLVLRYHIPTVQSSQREVSPQKGSPRIFCQGREHTLVI